MSASAVMWSPLLFGCALFLCSALLMMVQPMLGKTLLPHLGGNAVAWNACLVFFQATLLAGYVYAGLLHRFRGLRWQPWLQLMLMAIAIFLCFTGIIGDRLLVNLAPRLDALDTSPIIGTISLLVVTIGLPFLALAAIGPLVQRWFAHLDHPKSSDPYFLFVASNLGGLMGLIVYALMIEPNSPLIAQWMSWKLAVTALGVLLFLTALCAWQSPRSPEMEPQEKPTDPNAPVVPKLIGRGPATWGRRWYWFIASAIPVGLMMGLTDYLTLDFGPAPVLWAVPLAVYLVAAAQSFMRFSPLEYGGAWVRVTLQVAFGVLLASISGLFLIFAMYTVRPGPAEQNFTLMAFASIFVVLLLAPASWLWILQPISVLAVIFVQANQFQPALVSPGLVMLCLICGYLTARLSLSLLAKDRPAVPALTTYYGCIGLGGLGGGLFQLIAAPLLFRQNYLEFSLLAAAACLLRTNWLAHGLSDWLLSLLLFRKDNGQPESQATAAKARLALGFDVGIALVLVPLTVLFFLLRGLGEPIRPRLGWPPFLCDLAALISDYSLCLLLLACLLLVLRPLRFALSLVAIVALCWIGHDNALTEKRIVGQRTPFGIVRVLETDTQVRNPPNFTQRKLVCGTAHHGSCITDPPDMRRYPSTFYHRKGPVGQVMRKLEWFPVRAQELRNGKADFWLQHNRDNARDDARLAASLVGISAAPFPLGTLADAWSEPPYAFVGLGTGTLFTYAHPYQWVDAYELDPAIIALSTQTPPVFHYFQSAQQRGVNASVIPGDARRSLSKPGREGFYQVIFVDARNSNVMPVHLLTQEAVELYFQKLAPDGVVCFHTSNEHVDLAIMVENTARKLNLASNTLFVRPGAANDDPAFASSEWVVVASTANALRKWTNNDAFERGDQQTLSRSRTKLVWTDEHATVLTAVRPSSAVSGLTSAMLILLLFFGIFLGLIEITYSMAAVPVVKSAVKK